MGAPRKPVPVPKARGWPTRWAYRAPVLPG